MNGNECLSGDEEKHQKNVLKMVICVQLAKTCGNTVCSPFMCVKKRFTAGFACVWALVFSVFFHYTSCYSLVWKTICKKKVKGRWVSSKWFDFHLVCLQLSFVNQTMQHITVNLVLFKINLKCFYSNKDLILFRLLLPLCRWHRKCFAQGVALVAGLYKHLFILQCLFQTFNEAEISHIQAV